jgi:hypothetical protein
MTFCERYEVAIGGEIPAPALAHLRISWLAGETDNALPARLGSGAPLTDRAYVLEFKVAGRPGNPLPSTHRADYRFGQQIQLTGFDLSHDGRQVRVTLRWQALQDVSGEAVVFVHLRDTPDHALAQGDGVPVQGAYPTRLWKRGEIILDTHRLTLPEGTGAPPLALVVGMVSTADGGRLPVFDANGREQADDEVVLETGLVFP